MVRGIFNIREIFEHHVFPLILSTLKFLLSVISAAILTALTFYQFSRYFAPHTPLRVPLNFVLDHITPSFEDQNPLRSSQLLQANFSLLQRKYLDFELYVGTEYSIKVDLELADYDVNYDEGMFLVCLKHFDARGHVSWPVVYRWTPQQPSKKYGQCRPAILLRRSWISTALHFATEIPGKLLWSNCESTRKMEIILEEHFEQIMHKKSIKGMLTILSHSLQVVDGQIEYVPATTFASRNPFLISIFIWGCIFAFWFAMILIVQIYD